jgi:cytochrome P450
MPPWNPFFGHILFLYQRVQRFPSLANVNLVFDDIGHDFASDEMFLLDLWPIADPTLIVFNPEAAIQICQKLDLPKTKTNETMINPITGGITLLSMNSAEWKLWRGFFNPGFAPGVMMDHVPQIVDCAERFCGKLRSAAEEKGIVFLDDFMSRSTFEVICKILLLVSPKVLHTEPL